MIWKWVLVTVYCWGPCGVCQTRGRASHKPRWGIACRGAFRRGTILWVPGYGKGRVDDTGGGVGSNQIDLRFPNHRKALRWLKAHPKRRIRVKLLRRDAAVGASLTFKTFL